MIGLIELMVTRPQVNELVDRAVFFNPKSAIRNPKSKGWMLDAGCSILDTRIWSLETNSINQEYDKMQSAWRDDRTNSSPSTLCSLPYANGCPLATRMKLHGMTNED